MCGRYILTSSLEAIQRMFDFDQRPNLRPNDDVAPTREMPILHRSQSGDGLALLMARWGLIPPWAQDKQMAYATINACSETAASKPAFRDAFKKRRAVVLADGFIEWRRDGKDK